MEGDYSVRSFHGDYDIVVTHKGRVWTFPNKLEGSTKRIETRLTEQMHRDLMAAARQEEEQHQKHLAQVKRVARAYRLKTKAKRSDPVHSETARLAPPIEDRYRVARVDLTVRDGAVFDTVSTGKSMKVAGRYESPRICQMHVTNTGWAEGVVRFTSSADGTVRVTLTGPYVRSDDGGTEHVWVHYNAVVVDGAAKEAANPSFEEAGEKYFSAEWFAKRSYKPQRVVDEKLAKDGRAVLKVRHGGNVWQDFPVSAGEEVVVRFHARSAHESYKG